MSKCKIKDGYIKQNCRSSDIQCGNKTSKTLLDIKSDLVKFEFTD